MKKLVINILFFAILLIKLSIGIFERVKMLRWPVGLNGSKNGQVTYWIERVYSSYNIFRFKETFILVTDIILFIYLTIFIACSMYEIFKGPYWISAKIEMTKEKIKSNKQEKTEKRKEKLQRKLDKLNSEENE
jgi:hypothetical protein